MQNKFIKLQSTIDKREYHINSTMICSVVSYDDFSVIHSIGGQIYHVKENVEEILKLINKSENFTFITK